MIDIIIPVYNTRKYLAKCIRSVQKQTFTDWRLILVDDGSTDGSSEICDRFALRGDDKRIYVVHQENKGALKARLTGIANATAEFITFMDADDLAEPELLQRLMDAQTEHSADIVYCGCKTLSRHGWLKPEHRKTTDSVTVTSGMEEAVRVASALTSVSMWGKLYRKTVVDRAKELLDTIPLVFFGEDTMFNAAVFSKADKVAQIPDALYDYRVGGGSSGSTEKTMRELAELYRWRKNFLLQADADIKYHKANLAQVLNCAVYYAHFSRKLLSRDKICTELVDAIGDIESICPKYQHKRAYDLSIPMTDQEFKDIYHESPGVVIKQMILRIF